jgi:hypothetical protein
MELQIWWSTSGHNDLANPDIVEGGVLPSQLRDLAVPFPWTSGDNPDAYKRSNWFYEIGQDKVTDPRLTPVYQVKLCRKKP